METWKIIFNAVVVVFGLMSIVALILYTKKEKEEYEEKASRDAKDKILDILQLKVDIMFGLELNKIYESGTQDEIVRIVNLLAHETASACEREDKARRGGYFHPSQRSDAGFKKREWSEKRNLALQVCPELKERLPHFSEFEPLKSYREEHLLQKKAK